MFSLKSPELDQLFEAVLCLQSVEECRAFFGDLCTIKELQDLSQRLNVAIRLTEGKNYGDVSAETGVSATTISRINRCLVYGEGGYRIALDRLGVQGKKEKD